MCFRARVPPGVPLHGGIEAWADRPAAASGVGGDGYGLAEGLGRLKEGLGPGDAGVLAEEETTLMRRLGRTGGSDGHRGCAEYAAATVSFTQSHQSCE